MNDSTKILVGMTYALGRAAKANKSAAGKRGIPVLFHTGRACPALPERRRWML